MAIEDAVEHVNGFQGRGTTAEEYENQFGPFPVAASGLYAGAYEMECQQLRWFGLANLPDRTARYFGFHFKSDGLTTRQIIQIYSGDTLQGEIYHLNNGRLQLWSSGVLRATGTAILLAGIYYHLSIWYSVHDSTGRVQVKVEGASTLDIDFTGDTRNGGTGGQDRWRLGSPGGDPTHRFSSVVVLNGDHADAAHIPPSRVDSLFSNGEGDVIQGVPSTGTDNSALVDEAPPNAGDYVTFAAAGDEDLYTLGNLPSGLGQVFGVALVSHAFKSDTGVCEIKQQMKASGGTVAQGATHALLTAQRAYFDWFPDEPGAAGWSATAVNGLQIGQDRQA